MGTSAPRTRCERCLQTLGIQLVFVPGSTAAWAVGRSTPIDSAGSTARKDIGLATAIFATFLGSDPILVEAPTQEQKEKWLGAIAEDGIVFAYGATEPEAGSDLGAMKTKAVPDRGRWRGHRLPHQRREAVDLQRHHRRCDQHPGPGPAGPTWFVLREGHSRFLRAPSPRTSTGSRLSNTAALFLDNVEVPIENMVGGVEGKASCRPSRSSATPA